MSLTKEVIWEAAESLKLQGKQPKVAAVREILGKGSYSTINAAMQEWRQAQEAPTAPIREVAPAAITDRVELLSEDIWSIALSIANERLKADREALEAARLDMEASQAETAEMADLMADEIEKLRSDLQLSIETTEIHIASEKGTQQLLQNEIDNNIKLTEQLSGALQRYEDAKLENQSMLSLLEGEQADRKRMVQEHQQRDNERAVQIGKLEVQIASMAEKLEFSTKNASQYWEEAEKAKNDAQEAKNKENEARVDLAKITGETEALRNQVKQIEGLLKAFQNVDNVPRSKQQKTIKPNESGE